MQRHVTFSPSVLIWLRNANVKTAPYCQIEFIVGGLRRENVYRIFTFNFVGLTFLEQKQLFRKNSFIVLICNINVCHLSNSDTCVQESVYEKLYDETGLHVTFNGDARSFSPTGDSCCRYYFTFNDNHCSDPGPVSGITALNVNNNVHRPILSEFE